MRTIIIIVAAHLLVLAAAPLSADSLDGYPMLRESYDPRLQEQLETALQSEGLGRAVSEEKLGIALVDITDLEEPRMAAVNGDHMYYAASLPKIAILLGAFEQIERGRMALDEPTRTSLMQMIRYSSNVEATRMLHRVGPKYLLSLLQSERYRLYDPLVNGGLWVGKEYGKGAAYQRDPLHNLSHGATPLQTARFYYLLETEQLVGPRLTREMKTLLSKPGIEHKFVKGLSGLPDARIYRKSGTWRHWHADSAIVEAGRYKYIIVGLVEDRRGGEWLVRIARPLHDLIVPPKLARRTTH